MILLKSDRSNTVYLKKLRNGLFEKLKEFNDNIVYVYEVNLSNYNYQNYLMKDLEIFKTKNRNAQEKNIFYFQEGRFCTISRTNWKNCVYFCETINNYIKSLDKTYFRSLVPVKSVLHLIDNLTKILIEIYIICSNPDSGKQISKFKRNTTVCYNKECLQMLQVCKKTSFIQI